MLACIVDGTQYACKAAAMRDLNLSRYMVDKIIRLGSYNGHTGSLL